MNHIPVGQVQYTGFFMGSAENFLFPCFLCSRILFEPEIHIIVKFKPMDQLYYCVMMKTQANQVLDTN